MSDELVTVVMSTYNTPIKYLEKSIKSIINQTYKNFEFIIVCDGNIEEYNYIKKIKDNRIRIIFHEVNQGLPKSLNEAIRMANGKYIARMDSDDISKKNRLQIQLKYMKKNPQINIIGMNTVLFGKENRLGMLFFNSGEEIYYQLMFKNCIAHPTVMIKKSYLEQKEMEYNEKYECSQDFELWSNLCNKENCYILNKVGLFYRIHNKQIGIAKREKQKEYAKMIIQKNLDKYEVSNIKNIKEALCILGGLVDMTCDNYEMVSKCIDEILKNNNKKEKRVLVTSFFSCIIKNKIYKREFISIIKNKNIRNKIFNITNLVYFLLKIYCICLGKIYKRRLVDE